MSDPYSPSGPTGGIPAYNEPMLIAEPPGWPKVIGIISIVWGSLGTVCMGCGLAGTFVQPLFKNMVPPAQQAQMSQPPTSLGGIVLMAVSVILGVTLITAGIATLRRTAAGRTLHLAWGALVIVAIVAGIVNFVLVDAPAMQQWAKDNPKNPGEAMMGSGQWMIGSTVAVGVLRLAYPIFMLIWFGLIKTKHEQMHGGQDVGVG